ncbi:zinc finger protein, partial [Wuchereria bancrofti]
AAQTDQTEPLDLSISKVKEKRDGSQGLSMGRKDEGEIGLQVLQIKPLNLSAPKVRENGYRSQGLSVVGVSDERIKPLLRLFPIETPVEVTEQKIRTRKKQRCDICRKEVINMKQHLMTHTGEKPHSCPVCKRNFTDPSNTKKHMMIHTGRKPYSCPTCKRNFTRSGDMKIHMMTHNGEKPYSCQTCGKSFSRKQNLKSHVQTHGMNRTIYHCTVCSKDFSD